MRWLSFGQPGGERPGVLLPDGGVLDVAGQWPHGPRTWRGVLAREGGLARLERIIADGGFAARHVLALEDLQLAPPVPGPSKVIALGRNYPAHAAEQQRTVRAEPLLFAKAPSCLVGNRADVVVPPQESRPDYEAEMALLIGRRASAVPQSAALAHVVGVTAFNDVSGRAAQFGDKLWLRGKSFDTFGPIGPWAVTLDEIGDPDALALTCDINGERRQAASTAEMAFSAAAIVSYISHQMTLEPGDVIATGTPAGVGVFRDPPTFLMDGDEMVVTLEGVGRLCNRIVRRA